MPRKIKEKKEKKTDEKRERKGVSQRVVVNVKVGDTKRKPKRKYTRRPKVAGTTDGAKPGPAGVYSFTPAPVIIQQPQLPTAFQSQPQPVGLSLEDVRKVGREQAVGLLKEAEPAIRMAIEDISQKRVNEAVMKSQGAEQRAELEKKFVIPVSKGPIALAKEKLPSITRIKGQSDMTPENFGVGMNEILQDVEIKQEPVSVGRGTMIDLTAQEPVEVTGFKPSKPVINIEDEPKPKIKLRGRPVGSKNRPKDIILAEKEAKMKRKPVS